MQKCSIRSAEPADCEAIARIYNHYVRNTVITFEESDVPAPDMVARLEEVRDTGLPWLVVEDPEGIAGYAYAGKWKGRCAYRYSVETTIYLEPSRVGRGLGVHLYGALLEETRAVSLHAVIGGIALPNPASIRLHEKMGFEKVAHFREVGFKFNRWIDVGYWQRTL
jgi:phosphinothricin acetyltransferase